MNATLGFYVPPTAKVIRRWDLGFKDFQERCKQNSKQYRHSWSSLIWVSTICLFGPICKYMGKKQVTFVYLQPVRIRKKNQRFFNEDEDTSYSPTKSPRKITKPAVSCHSSFTLYYLSRVMRKPVFKNFRHKRGCIATENG